MNASQPSRATLAAYAVCILGSLLIVYALVWTMQYYTAPAPVNQSRIEERKKALAEQRAADEALVNHYGWVDQARGIVRLPVTNAMELTVREYRNPAAARSNLMARVEKATAAPPKAPEKPSQFE